MLRTKHPYKTMSETAEEKDLRTWYRAERIRRNLTQGALGKLLGIHNVSVSYRETGRRRITVEAKLAMQAIPIPTEEQLAQYERMPATLDRPKVIEIED